MLRRGIREPRAARRNRAATRARREKELAPSL